MKKSNLLLTFLVMFFALSLVFSARHVLGQQAGDDKEVKVKVVQKINGETKTIEKVFSTEDEAELKEFLKEYNLDIDPDDLLNEEQVEINIRKTIGDDETDDVYIDLEKTHAEVERSIDESYAFLGVYTATFVDDETKKLGFPVEHGVVVTKIVSGSAAEKAGLQNGDIITKVGGIEITDSDQFRETIRSFKPEQEVAIIYYRNGKQAELSATLGEKKMVREYRFMGPDDKMWHGHFPPMIQPLEELKDKPFLGVTPGEQTEKSEGVTIGPIVEKSTASELGLQKGDVVVEINDKPIKSFSELADAVGTVKVGEQIKVEWKRDGKTMKSSSAMKSKADCKIMCHPGEEEHFFHGPMRWMEESKEVTKEELQKAIERLELKMDNLKEQLEKLDAAEKNVETNIRITIEDAAPASLKAENLMFSPNPNNGKFSLSFELPEKGKTTIKIFDVNNKEIYSESLGKFSGRYDKQIDVSENPKGIYFLQIIQDDKSLNKKIVIQ